MTAVAPTTPLQLPSVPLVVPQVIADLMGKALGEAATLAGDYGATHSLAEEWMLPSFALNNLSFPPSGEKEQAELALMHRIEATRTPEQTQTAQFWASHGLTDAWDIYLAEYAKKVGPRQAAAAAKLLHDTLNVVNTITQTAKSASLRTRPYNVDPTLTVAITKPGNSPSYPSGHTSAAYAAAVVLSYLMPARSKEFADLALQASYARVYGGVHFPSDIAAGAKLATTVALAMCAIDKATHPVIGFPLDALQGRHALRASQVRHTPARRHARRAA